MGEQIINLFKKDKLRQNHIRLIEQTKDPIEQGKYLIQLDIYDDYMGYDIISKVMKERYKYGKRN